MNEYDKDRFANYEVAIAVLRLRLLKQRRGESAMSLSFEELRKANMLRLPQFKNAKGERAHPADDGSDWSLADWMVAIVGELGELANLQKKVRRGDLTLDEALIEMGREIADVQTYLDIYAYQLRLDLGVITAEKFNKVSERVGSDVRL